MSLTMAQGMKRLGMPVAAFFGVALIGLIATSWFLNRDALREAVEAQIRAVTGLDLVVKGTIDVSVFPASYVSFHDVGLKGGGTADPALHVDVLTANLRLLPLLLRRFEISDVMMLRPTHPRGPRRQWREQLDAVRRHHRAHDEARGAENEVSFSETVSRTAFSMIVDGWSTTPPRRSATSISGWPGRRSRAASRYRPIRLARGASRRSAPAISSRCCGRQFRLEGAARRRTVKLAFDGPSQRPSLKIEGTLAVRRRRCARRCAGAAAIRCRSGGFGRLALKARANLAGGTWC